MWCVLFGLLRGLVSFRLFLVGVGFVLCVLLFVMVGFGVVNWVLYDYLVWLVFICSFLGVFLDFLCFYRSFGYASTLSLDLVALGFVFAGRFGSLILSFVRTSFLTPLIGGGIVDLFTLRIGLLVVPGCFLGFATVGLHSVVGEPLVLAPSRSWAEILHELKGFVACVAGFFRKHYLLSSFALGFVVRVIPEVAWWPWHIGWDTVEYVAHLMDFLVSPNPFQPHFWMSSLRNIPPLLDLVLALPAYIMGAWVTFKLYPPLAFGALAAMSAFLARRALKLSPGWSIIAALASSLFILNLRISWDYQRQVLGTVIMMLTLTLMETGSPRNAGKAAVYSVLLILMAMSHEVTGVVSFTLALTLLLESLRRKNRYEVATYSTALALITALLLWYWRKPYTPNIYLGAAPPGIVAYSAYPSVSAEVVSYLLVGYGLVIPPMLTVLGKSELRYLKVAFATLFIAGISPLIMPFTSVTCWWRFLIGASPLTIPLAVAGISSSTKKSLIALYLLLIIAPGFFFIWQGKYLSKIIPALREFPGELTPSPKSISHLRDLHDLSRYVSKLDPGTPIVVEAHVGRWVHLGIRNPEPGRIVRLWRKPGINDACNVAARTNKTVVYLITTLTNKTLVNDARNYAHYGECGPYSKGEFEINIELLRNGIYKVYEVRITPKKSTTAENKNSP